MPKSVSDIGVKPGASSPADFAPDLEAHKLWIHCNRCCEQYALKKSQFFLLACHHVACDKCVKVCTGRKPTDTVIYDCPICHGQVRGRQVTNTMPNHIKQFFHPEPFNMNNEYIVTFQMTNHRHFERFKGKRGAKVKKLKKDINLAKSICQKRYFNLEIMRVEHKKLTQRMRHVKIQVANQREDKEKEKRMAVDRHIRNLTQPRPGSGFGQEQHRAKTNSPTTSIHKNYRITSITSSSSSKKNQQVTGFRHQPNYSFNL